MKPDKTPIKERASRETPLSKLEVWLDSNNVLKRLFITSRTLARWRKKKIIAFTRVGGKFYYREEDVQLLFLKYWENQSNNQP